MQKYGTRRGVQRYRCLSCTHSFQSKRRPQKQQRLLYARYARKRDSVADLAEKQHRSMHWIQQQLDAASPVCEPCPPQATVIAADTTFWGRSYGVCVFRSPSLKRNLCWTEVVHETAAVYRQNLTGLQARGWRITGAVIDGRRGVASVFEQQGIPVQFCQFHQMKTVTKYLTRKPKTEAGQELRRLSCTLHKTTEQEFTQALTDWCARWESFLSERSVASHKKRGWEYTHRSLRAAYRSLVTNLPYLFTYQKHPELGIPNTTNTIDGTFSQLKKKVGAHNGLRRDRRFKLISVLLANRSKTPTRKRH